MNKLKRLFSITLMLLFLGMGELRAQLSEPSGYFNFSWQTSTPLGDASDWIDKTSFTGINFEGLGFITPNIALGGEISHNYTYETFDNKTYNYDSDNFEAAVTGVQYRSTRIIPALFKGYYYLNTTQMVQPYVSLGAGMAYMENDFIIGIHGLTVGEWGFSSTAELGANFFPSAQSGVGIIANVKYSYSNINLTGLTSNNVSRLIFNLGVTFALED